MAQSITQGVVVLTEKIIDSTQSSTAVTLGTYPGLGTFPSLTLYPSDGMVVIYRVIHHAPITFGPETLPVNITL